MKHPALRILIGVILPVTAGFVIYLLFRPHGLLFYAWMDRAGIGSFSTGPSGVIIRLPDYPWTGWLRFSLPGGLWIFAFANALLFIWRDAAQARKVLVACLLGISYAVYEAGQAFGVINGTFDLSDVVTCLFALAVSIILNVVKGGRYYVREIKEL